jgi:hypothetical protein
MQEIPSPDNIQANASSPWLSILAVQLLKGPLYAQEKPKAWSALLEIQQHLRTYLSVLNLSLYLDEAEGYAFLRQIEAENSDDPLPRLIQRRPLGFALSVLCILLRQWLAEHDVKGGDLRAIISREQIHTELSLYLPELRSEAKLSDRIDHYIKQAKDLGLVRELRGDPNKLEILRITKALINAEWLGNLDEQLELYRKHIANEEKESGDV